MIQQCNDTSSFQLVLLHPEYDPDQLINDIAILVVRDPFIFSSDIGRVCLPFPGDVYSNQRCIATGYGKDSFGTAGYYSKELKKVDLPLIDQETCQETLNQEYFASKDFNFVIHGSFICAGGIVG